MPADPSGTAAGNPQPRATILNFFANVITGPAKKALKSLGTVYDEVGKSIGGFNKKFKDSDKAMQNLNMRYVSYYKIVDKTMDHFRETIQDTLRQLNIRGEDKKSIINMLQESMFGTKEQMKTMISSAKNTQEAMDKLKRASSLLKPLGRDIMKNIKSKEGIAQQSEAISTAIDAAVETASKRMQSGTFLYRLFSGHIEEKIKEFGYQQADAFISGFAPGISAGAIMVSGQAVAESLMTGQLGNMLDLWNTTRSLLAIAIPNAMDITRGALSKLDDALGMSTAAVGVFDKVMGLVPWLENATVIRSVYLRATGHVLADTNTLSYKMTHLGKVLRDKVASAVQYVANNWEELVGRLVMGANIVIAAHLENYVNEIRKSMALTNEESIEFILLMGKLATKTRSSFEDTYEAVNTFVIYGYKSVEVLELMSTLTLKYSRMTGLSISEMSEFIFTLDRLLKVERSSMAGVLASLKAVADQTGATMSQIVSSVNSASEFLLSVPKKFRGEMVPAVASISAEMQNILVDPNILIQQLNKMTDMTTTEGKRLLNILQARIGPDLNIFNILTGGSQATAENFHKVFFTYIDTIRSIPKTAKFARQAWADIFTAGDVTALERLIEVTDEEMKKMKERISISQDYEKNISKMTELWRNMTNTLTEMFVSLKREVTGSMAAIGASFLNVLESSIRPFINAMYEMNESFQDMSNQKKKIVSYFASFTFLMSGLIASFFKGKVLSKTFKGGITAFIDLLHRTGRGIANLGTKIAESEAVKKSATSGMISRWKSEGKTMSKVLLWLSASHSRLAEATAEGTRQYGTFFKTAEKSITIFKKIVRPIDTIITLGEKAPGVGEAASSFTKFSRGLIELSKMKVTSRGDLRSLFTKEGWKDMAKGVSMSTKNIFKSMRDARLVRVQEVRESRTLILRILKSIFSGGSGIRGIMTGIFGLFTKAAPKLAKIFAKRFLGILFNFLLVFDIIKMFGKKNGFGDWLDSLSEKFELWAGRVMNYLISLPDKLLVWADKLADDVYAYFSIDVLTDDFNKGTPRLMKVIENILLGIGELLAGFTIFTKKLLVNLFIALGKIVFAGIKSLSNTVLMGWKKLIALMLDSVMYKVSSWYRSYKDKIWFKIIDRLFFAGTLSSLGQAALQATDRNFSFLDRVSINQYRESIGYGNGEKRSQSGFHGIVRKPTRFLVGEAGPEHVHIEPLHKYQSRFSKAALPKVEVHVETNQDEVVAAIKELTAAILGGRGIFDRRSRSYSDWIQAGYVAAQLRYVSE